MKTKVVQHVPRINFKAFKFSGFQVQNERNSRIVTLLFSDVPTDYNGFTGAMRRLLCWTCSCLRGARTASCCCHVTAAYVALMARWFYTSTKRPMIRIKDLWRSDSFQPNTLGGPPVGPRGRVGPITGPPHPPRRTDDRRERFNERFNPGFTPTATQPRTPHPAFTSQPPSTTPPPPPVPGAAATPQANGQPAPCPVGLKGLVNPRNTCFVNAVVQLMASLGADQQLAPVALGNSPLDVAINVLTATFQQQVADCANPNVLPFSTVPLRDAVNSVLIADNRQVSIFDPNVQNCSWEFIVELFKYLSFNQNFFSKYPMSGQCTVCNAPHQTRQMDYDLFHLPLPDQVVPVDLDNLVQGASAHLTQLPCHALCPTAGVGGCGNACRQVMYNANPTVALGQYSLVVVNRVPTSGQQKIATRLVSPAAMTAFPGQQCRAVLCHSGPLHVGGHWIAFVRWSPPGGQPTWWQLDDNLPVIARDPFLTQTNPANPGQVGPAHTISILVFG